MLSKQTRDATFTTTTTKGAMGLDFRGKEIIFESFWPLLKKAYFFKAARAVVKIGLSLKPNHQILPS